MSARRLLPCALALAFSGCVGLGGEGPGPRDVSVVEDGASVAGLVLSDELFPIEDALVTLGDLPPATTDDGGRFEIPGVAPGRTYPLAVNATAYRPYSQELEVPGTLTNVQVVLEGIPGVAPYSSTVLFTGWDACSFSAVYTAGPVGDPCPFGKAMKILKVEVGPGWAAGVHEMSWKTQEQMIFASSVTTEQRPGPDASCTTSGETHAWCPAMIWGASPLRIVARPNDTEYAAKYAIDGKETWPGGRNHTSYIFESYSGFLRQEINGTFYDQCRAVNQQFDVPAHWGCPFGVGYSTGLRFEFYHTTFYLGAPQRLEEFTAIPDG